MGLNKYLLFSTEVLIFPIKMSNLFFCKLIISKILSAKGPDENLYLVFLFNSKIDAEMYPFWFSNFLHLFINSSISFWNSKHPFKKYFKPLENFTLFKDVLSSNFLW